FRVFLCESFYFSILFPSLSLSIKFRTLLNIHSPYTTLFRSHGRCRDGPVRAAPAGRRRPSAGRRGAPRPGLGDGEPPRRRRRGGDRKSTRLNSSHVSISYAVFCLKKKIQ